MNNWAYESVFYHIYPLGLCGAAKENDLSSPVNYSLDRLYGWVDNLKGMGVNAIYLGPIFESKSHGYDTTDYYNVDRRLGDNQSLSKLSDHLHSNGIRLVLDAVFNHVGRDFWAFQDLLENGEDSPYRDWFEGVNFEYQSPYGDPFTYNAWEGHYNLVNLNLKNPEVKEYLFGAVKKWVDEFDIDGLRLDAADCLDIEFIRELKEFCNSIKDDFWLLGEIIHGDYRKWAGEGLMDSVTNYECYKGLYSSHNDKNYFEIAHSLKRQFGEKGVYKDLFLYSFVDNHDVHRIASRLKGSSHLYPLHILLFTIPGAPSIYYGSEWGIEGRKKGGDDSPVRPQLDIDKIEEYSLNIDLRDIISRLSKMREGSKALRQGNYKEVFVDDQQFAFLRELDGEKLLIVVNASEDEIDLQLDIDLGEGYLLRDLLNPSDEFHTKSGGVEVNNIPPMWGRIMKVEGL